MEKYTQTCGSTQSNRGSCKPPLMDESVCGVWGRDDRVRTDDLCNVTAAL